MLHATTYYCFLLLITALITAYYSLLLPFYLLVTSSYSFSLLLTTSHCSSLLLTTSYCFLLLLTDSLLLIPTYYCSLLLVTTSYYYNSLSSSRLRPHLPEMTAKPGLCAPKQKLSRDATPSQNQEIWALGQGLWIMAHERLHESVENPQRKFC